MPVHGHRRPGWELALNCSVQICRSRSGADQDDRRADQDDQGQIRQSDRSGDTGTRTGTTICFIDIVSSDQSATKVLIFVIEIERVPRFSGYN